MEQKKVAHFVAKVTNEDVSDDNLCAKLLLVDLVGSESANRTDADGQRFEEGYMIMYLIIDAAFSHGMNPHIFVTYRHVLGGLVMFPFAYFLERKVRPKMTLALFFEMFLLSLVGVSLTLNMYFASLEYTSPTFGTSMINAVASLTFVIAVAFRLEAFDVRNARGIAKVVGTLKSLAGVMTMTLYKGPEVQRPILAGASCISWSLWYIRQAFTLKKYPAQLSLTAWINLIGGAQSAAFTVLIQHKPASRELYAQRCNHTFFLVKDCTWEEYWEQSLLSLVYTWCYGAKKVIKITSSSKRNLI
nr:wat1-related protein [Quercus suber]